MPLVIRPRTGGRRRLLATAAALLATTGVVGGSAHAAPAQATVASTSTAGPVGSCTAGEGLWPRFAVFGDDALYTLAPGGSFETASAPWTLNGNSVVAGNERFQLNATTDVRSLSVRPSSSVVSPSFCVDSSTPFLRFVAQKATAGALTVRLEYADPTHGTRAVRTAGTVVMGGAHQNGDYADWAPTPTLRLSSALPLAKSPTGTLDVRVRVTADGEPGAWRVDDVFVDPFRAG